MKKIVFLFFLCISTLIMAAVSVAPLSTDVTIKPDTYWWTSHVPGDRGWAWMKEVDSTLKGTKAFSTAGISFLESTGATYYTTIKAGNQSGNVTYTLPTADGSNGYVLSTNASGVLSWIANAGTFAGGSITDDIVMANGKYIQSSETTAQASAIQVWDTTSVAAYTNVLSWTNGTIPAIVLGETTNTLSIVSSGGIQVSTAGVITGATGITNTGTIANTGGLTTTTLGVNGTVTLESAETIANSTNSEIKFAENAGEDFIFDMDSAANAIGLKSSTGVDELAMGAVDDLTGVGTIDFDAAASTVTLTSTGDAQDLTIAVAGANNSSLVLNSSGTAADAMTLATSAGGMDLTVAGAAANEDLDLLSNTSINITATEGIETAIVLNASTATGGIDITSNADIDISTTGTAGEDISLLNTGGSVNITATEADTAAIVLNASTALGGIDITSQEDIDITTTGAAGEDITITNTGGSVNINATEDEIDSIKIAASGGINIDAANDIDILLTSGGAGEDINIATTGAQDNHIAISSTGTSEDAISLTSTAGGINLTATGAAGEDIDITAATSSINLTATEAVADQIKLSAAGAVSGNAINIATTDGGIILNAGGAAGGDVSLTSADDITLTTTGDLALAITGNITGSVKRATQQYIQSVAYAKLGASGAGWVIGAADSVSLATLPASQTAENMVIPVTIPLKVGWTITAFTVVGQIESGGNTVTLDADLRKHTTVATDVADASVGAIVQISVTADTAVATAKSGLSEVVAADETFYVLITGTTAASTDVAIQGITVTVSEI